MDQQALLGRRQRNLDSCFMLVEVFGFYPNSLLFGVVFSQAFLPGFLLCLLGLSLFSGSLVEYSLLLVPFLKPGSVLFLVISDVGICQLRLFAQDWQLLLVLLGFFEFQLAIARFQFPIALAQVFNPLRCRFLGASSLFRLFDFQGYD